MIRKCKNCGAPFRLSDGRYKYCSDECSIEAHRRQCRENYRRRYVIRREDELTRNRRYYWERKEAQAKK